MSLTRTNQYKDFHTFDGIQHDNHYDFVDAKTWLTKQVGYITGNPALVAAANAQEIALKAVEDSGAVPPLTTEQKEQLLASNVTTGQAVQGEAQVKVVGSIFSGLKWIIYAAVIVVIFVVLVEIKKAVS